MYSFLITGKYLLSLSLHGLQEVEMWDRGGNILDVSPDGQRILELSWNVSGELRAAVFSIFLA